MATFKQNAFAALTLIGGMTAASLVVIPAIGAETTGSITGTVFEDANRDGVQQTDEAPWPDVTLHVLTADRSSFVGQGTTDHDGGYQVAGLPTGEYSVELAPMSWWDVRSEWVPTTTGSVWPRITVDLDGSANASFGWRPLVRSTDLAAPVSEHVGPEGLTVQSFVDAVDASEVHQRVAGGTIGDEAPHVTIRLGYGSSDSTTTGVGQSDGQYTSYSAVSYVSWLSWLDSGDRILSHEYGHAWSNYNAYMVQQDPTLTGYLEARGLAGDERVGTSYAWSPKEMIAEDYRQLLGFAAGRTYEQVNREIPPAPEVPGLLEYLRDEYTSSDGAPDPDPDPTPDPDSTVDPTPDPTDDAADTVAPEVEILSPSDGSSVNGSFTVVVRASDNVSAPDMLTFTVRLGNGDAVTATWDAATGRFRVTLNAKGLKGTQTVSVVGRDQAGNRSESASDVQIGKGGGSSGKGHDKG